MNITGASPNGNSKTRSARSLAAIMLAALAAIGAIALARNLTHSNAPTPPASPLRADVATPVTAGRGAPDTNRELEDVATPVTAGRGAPDTNRELEHESTETSSLRAVGAEAARKTMAGEGLSESERRVLRSSSAFTEEELAELAQRRDSLLERLEKGTLSYGEIQILRATCRMLSDDDCVSRASRELDSDGTR